MTIRAQQWLAACLCVVVAGCGGPSAATGKAALERANVAEQLMIRACSNFADVFLITQVPPPPPLPRARKIAEMDSAARNAAAAAKDDFNAWAIGSQAIERLDEGLRRSGCPRDLVGARPSKQDLRPAGPRNLNVSRSPSAYPHV